MKKIFGILTAIVIVAFALLCFTACGKTPVSITVVDNLESTEVSAYKGNTVSQVLSEANITVGEKDEVSPAADSKIDENTQIEIKRYAKVTVSIDGKDTTVEMNGATVAQALEKAGITLGKKDKLQDCELTDALTDAMTIKIIKGKTVNIVVSGKSKKYTVASDKVKDILAECSIEYDDDDKISPSLNKTVKKNATITVQKVEVKRETVTETIKYKTETKYSSSMKKGTSTVTRKGSNGEKTVEYERTYIDGELTQSKVISEKTVKEPVNKIITYGTKVEATTSAPKTTSGKTIVSKEPVYDCDGSGHGYYVITYSDGSVAYKDF